MNFDHIFNDLEISAAPFALCELNGPGNIGLGREAAATLHYVLHGEGEITLPGHAPIRLSKGSLALVPGLSSHSLRSLGYGGNPLPDCKPAALNLRHILHRADVPDEAGGQLVALCARVTVGLKGASDLINLIREPLIECVSTQSPLQPLVISLLNELSAPQLGSEAMIRAVLLQAMIAMLRNRLAEEDKALHWMAALKDPTVWEALRLMLDQPGDPHTVESLALKVGMSRSTFARRFTEAYESGPIELLRDLRIRRAAHLLQHSTLPVKRIADQVGFSSRSAFSRQFEATTGQSPSRFRQTQLGKL